VLSNITFKSTATGLMIFLLTQLSELSGICHPLER